ncbi:LysM domain-containing protein [Vibrio sp. SCSIO 43135]|uniref:LysM peptidoglycan-binding domain-containing protein n=1 Tax=Vibrio sp. SCSIO 43135 TaxID=2819096 RepID=UPI002074CAD3|nr:LysM domain-containing protein [Vibrio sp. SCSIO 43135]
MSTHLIRRGETLSMLAEKYNTTVDVLLSLNAAQIKDIDIIYDGDTLVLPKTIVTAAGEREEKQILPDEQLVLAQCSVPEYVDALYVPEHPKSKKQLLILLTKEAKQYVVEDNQRCQAALSGDKDTVLSQLTKLGVMDQFNSIAHESFLQQISADKAQSYRSALLEYLALSRSYVENTLVFPAENRAIGLDEVDKHVQDIEQQYHSALEEIELKSKGSLFVPVDGIYGEIMLKKDAIAGAEASYTKRLKRLQETLLGSLQQCIEGFESEAINYAADLQLEDKGQHYQFSKQHDFYSSNVDLKVFHALERVKKGRKEIDLDDSLISADLSSASPILQLDKAKASYDFWAATAHPILMRLMNQQVDWNPASFFKLNNNHISRKYREFFIGVYQLNQSGVLLKEQCLDEAELFEGWEAVDEVKASIIEQRPSIDDLTKQLNKLNTATPITNKLGYYSAYTLNLVLLQEVALRVQDFAERFGENEQYAQYVQKLIGYSEDAQSRCSELLELAESRAQTPFWNYQKKEVTYLGDIPMWDDSTNMVVTKESNWKPRNFNNQIFADSGANSRTVVECALSSKPKEPIYILSDSPVLSSDLAQNKQCTSVMSLNNSAQVARAKEPITQAISNALGGISEAKLTSFKFEKTVSLDTVEDVVFPWQTAEYKNEMFGINCAYETSGGAQFARFTYGAEAIVDQDILGSDNSAVKAEFTSNLALASAENKIVIRFPASGEMPLDIPYRTKESTERHTHNIGASVLEIEGKVYGVVGASVKLGTQIHIGNMESVSYSSAGRQVSALGIKGTTPNQADFSSFSASASDPVSSSIIAAGAKAEASAFAGLEAGGILTCKYDWKKSAQAKKQNLFKVSSGLKVTAGIGYEGVLQCTFHNGRFVFITALGSGSWRWFWGQVCNRA